MTGTITSWNRGAEEIFGYTSGEVVGKPISILFPKDRLNLEKPIDPDSFVRQIKEWLKIPAA